MKKVLGIFLLAACTVVPAPAPQADTRTLAAAVDRAITEGHPDQAQKALLELLGRPHVELEVLLACGAKLAERERFEPARAVFARAVQEYPRSFEAHYNLALADIALRRFDEARAALEAPVEASKDQQAAREYLRGKIHEAAGEPALAERCFTAAFSAAPEEENYALDLGMFYLRQPIRPRHARFWQPE